MLVGFYFFLFFSEVEVPYSDGLIVRSGIKILAVGMQGQGTDPVIMTDKCM